jgi:predicted TIM-barrel fold metal-dependent hydrolase
MTDTHIHIGQFEHLYYQPREILQIVSDCEIKACVYSSTSSCKEGVKYHEIQREIESVISIFSPTLFKPYLWYIPSYKTEGISVENAMNNLPYQGIKIHPVAHDWNNEVGNEILHELFEYSSEHSKPILIHTGENGKDAPDVFEYFFKQYPKALCILAHGRPIDKTLEMMKRYSNVWCDTAFMSEKNLQKIVENGFSSRVLLGTDFPITHYWNVRSLGKDQQSNVTLHKQYEKDLSVLERFSRLRLFQNPLKG